MPRPLESPRPDTCLPSELSPLERSQWAAWSGGNAFLHPEFALQLERQRTDVRVALLRDGSTLLGFLPHHARKSKRALPLGLRLSDWQGPVTRPDWRPGRRELLARSGLRSFEFRAGKPGLPAVDESRLDVDHAPWVDLSGGFEAYRRRSIESGSRVIPQLERKQRKITREVGDLRVVAWSGEHEALDTLFRWKSVQRERTQSFDVLQLDWVRRALIALVDAEDPGCRGQLSLLYAGDRLAAAHLGLRSRETLHCWFPGFEPELGRYSPGAILALALLEEAADEGVRRFDFGRGDHTCKSRLSTDCDTVVRGYMSANTVEHVARRAAHRTALGAKRALARTPFASIVPRVRDRLLALVHGGSSRPGMGGTPSPVNAPAREPRSVA